MTFVPLFLNTPHFFKHFIIFSKVKKSHSLSRKPTFLICILQPEKPRHQLFKQLPLLQKRNWDIEDPPLKTTQTHKVDRLSPRIARVKSPRRESTSFLPTLCNVNIKDACVHGCSSRYCKEAIPCKCKGCSSSVGLISRVTLMPI